MPENRPRVIINGDDYGYSDGVNAGIVEAYESGILTSTTVLANGNFTGAPLNNLLSELVKHPIGIGVHLNLTTGRPLVAGWHGETFTRPFKGLGLSAEWQGSAWKEYFAQFSGDLVRQEFRAQIDKVIKEFGRVDHLDSHQGVASYPPVTEVYEELARQFGLPVRHLSPMLQEPRYGGRFNVRHKYPLEVRGKGLKTVDRVNMDYFSMDVPDPAEFFCRELEKVKPGEVWEFMFHPSADTTQGEWRLTDLRVLTHPQVIRTIRNTGIQLTTYRESAY